MSGRRGRLRQPDGSYAPRAVQRLIAGGWVAFCLLLLASEFSAPEDVQPNRTLAPIVFALMIAVGAAILLLPWSRWRPATLLWLLPVVFAMIGLNWRFGRQDGFVYAMAFLAVFLIVGMTQAPGTSLRLSPLLVFFYVAPLIGVSTQRAGPGMASAILVVPVCVATGELVAWGVARIRRSEEVTAEANQRYLLSFEGAPTGMTQTSPSGILVHVNRAFASSWGATWTSWWDCPSRTSPTPRTGNRMPQASDRSSTARPSASPWKSASSGPTAPTCGSSCPCRWFGTSRGSRCICSDTPKTSRSSGSCGIDWPTRRDTTSSPVCPTAPSSSSSSTGSWPAATATAASWPSCSSMSTDSR